MAAAADSTADGWSCPACTLLNDAAAAACTMCGGPRPAADAADAGGAGGGSGGGDDDDAAIAWQLQMDEYADGGRTRPPPRPAAQLPAPYAPALVIAAPAAPPPPPPRFRISPPLAALSALLGECCSAEQMRSHPGWDARWWIGVVVVGDAGAASAAAVQSARAAGIPVRQIDAAGLADDVAAELRSVAGDAWALPACFVGGPRPYMQRFLGSGVDAAHAVSIMRSSLRSSIHTRFMLYTRNHHDVKSLMPDGVSDLVDGEKNIVWNAECRFPYSNLFETLDVMQADGGDLPFVRAQCRALTALLSRDLPFPDDAFSDQAAFNGGIRGSGAALRSAMGDVLAERGSHVELSHSLQVVTKVVAREAAQGRLLLCGARGACSAQALAVTLPNESPARAALERRHLHDALVAWAASAAARATDAAALARLLGAKAQGLLAPLPPELRAACFGAASAELDAWLADPTQDPSPAGLRAGVAAFLDHLDPRAPELVLTFAGADLDDDTAALADCGVGAEALIDARGTALAAAPLPPHFLRLAAAAPPPTAAAPLVVYVSGVGGVAGRHPVSVAAHATVADLRGAVLRAHARVTGGDADLPPATSNG